MGRVNVDGRDFDLTDAEEANIRATQELTKAIYRLVGKMK